MLFNRTSRESETGSDTNVASAPAQEPTYVVAPASPRLVLGGPRDYLWDAE